MAGCGMIYNTGHRNVQESHVECVRPSRETTYVGEACPPGCSEVFRPPYRDASLEVGSEHLI